jgi:short-subunit dehydrogenase
VEIAGKIILITGASEGIGAACAREFLNRGAEVALMARNREKLEQVAPGKALAVPGDLTIAADRERCVEQTLARYGRIDILINNAGAGLYAPSWQADPEQVRALWELNFFAPLEMVRLVAPLMRKQKSGMVVNVGSIAGKVTLPWLTLYSSTKYALGSWTDGLRMELRRDGIHAMTVCPGYVSTRFQDHILGGAVPPAVKAGNWLRITAEQCATAIADGVERNARTVVTPKTGWLLVLAARLLPGVLDGRLAGIYERGSNR